MIELWKNKFTASGVLGDWYLWRSMESCIKTTLDIFFLHLKVVFGNQFQLPGKNFELLVWGRLCKYTSRCQIISCIIKYILINKWCSISTCFVLSWQIVFDVSSIALSLSPNSFVGLSLWNYKHIYLIRLLNQYFID